MNKEKLVKANTLYRRMTDLEIKVSTLIGVTKDFAEMNTYRTPVLALRTADHPEKYVREIELSFEEYKRAVRVTLTACKAELRKVYKEIENL